MAYDPATDLNNLLTIRSNLLAQLATNGIKPSYNIDGRQVSWGELKDWLAEINASIQAMQGPVEVISEGYV